MAGISLLRTPWVGSQSSKRFATSSGCRWIWPASRILGFWIFMVASQPLTPGNWPPDNNPGGQLSYLALGRIWSFLVGLIILLKRPVSAERAHVRIISILLPHLTSFISYLYFDCREPWCSSKITTRDLLYCFANFS